MRTQRAMRFVRVLRVIGACGAVLVPLPADAFELSGGVSFGGLQIGAEPMSAVSPFVGLLWRTWFFFGPLGVSVSGNLDWIVQGSRIVAEGPVGMITAGPVVRLEAR